MKVEAESLFFSRPLPEEEAIALSPTLLPPIALLSSHLTVLRGFLSEITLITLYRRLASRLAEHILHRQILYRGRARLSSSHGQVMRAEANLWVDTCRAALGSVGEGGRARIEAPWLRLLEGTILVAATGEDWSKLVDALVRNPRDDEVWQKEVDNIVGFSELGWEETRQVIATREDCPR